MDRLSKIDEILVKEGHKLNDHSYGSYCVSRYQIVHHNIVSISISVRNDITTSLFIEVEPLSVQVYTNKGYSMYPCYVGRLLSGYKELQSFEDLLDELHDLELIKYGHNVKRSSM